MERGVFELPFMIFFGILHPSSAVRVQWDLYILLLLGTVCILTPFMICFDLVVERVSFLGAPAELLSPWTPILIASSVRLLMQQPLQILTCAPAAVKS